MTAETGSDQPRESDQPNEEGFAGDPTTPQPQPGDTESEGEDIAVPAGDLTAPVMSALEDVSSKDDDDS